MALCSPRTRAARNTVCQLREDCYLLPVNGLFVGILNCSPISPSFRRFLPYSAIRLLFFPAVSTCPLCQTSRFRCLYFSSPNCSCIIALLFPVNPHEVRYRDLWRALRKRADMMGSYLCFYGFYPFPLTQLPQSFSNGCFLFPAKYLPAVLWCKHDMIFAIPSRMGEAIDVIQSYLNVLPLLFFVQLADRTLMIAKGVSLSFSSPQAFLYHSPGEWFSLYKKTRRSARRVRLKERQAPISSARPASSTMALNSAADSVR